MVMDGDLGDAQTLTDEARCDFVVGFESAGFEHHGFERSGGIKLVSGEGVGDPAAVEKESPERKNHAGEPGADALPWMAAGSESPTAAAEFSEDSAAIDDV